MPRIKLICGRSTDLVCIFLPSLFTKYVLNLSFDRVYNIQINCYGWSGHHNTRSTPFSTYYGCHIQESDVHEVWSQNCGHSLVQQPKIDYLIWKYGGLGMVPEVVWWPNGRSKVVDHPKSFMKESQIKGLRASYGKLGWPKEE